MVHFQNDNNTRSNTSTHQIHWLVRWNRRFSLCNPKRSHQCRADSQARLYKKLTKTVNMLYQANFISCRMATLPKLAQKAYQGLTMFLLDSLSAIQYYRSNERLWRWPEAHCFSILPRIWEAKKPAALPEKKLLVGHNGGKTINITRNIERAWLPCWLQSFQRPWFRPSTKENQFCCRFPQSSLLIGLKTKIPMKPLSEILENDGEVSYYAFSGT